jgi:L-2-hydroxyglutarate oxidase LhgO
MSTGTPSDTAHDAEVLVIGAGIIGLAVAQELARDRSVLVVERLEGMARETSAHNSGVVHASVYYPTGSLKHRLCWEGNAALYAWCERYGVPVLRCGKLIVALAEDERGGLDDVWRQASANEVRGIERWTGAQSRELEPHIPIVEAIWSPSTGVVDQYALARSYEAVALDRGALVVYRHEVTGIERIAGGFRVTLRDADGAESRLTCAVLVNSAGLRAPQMAELLGYPLDGGSIGEGIETPVLRQRVNRGRYYDIVDPEIARLVGRPIYPLPEHGAGGLGMHLTTDTDGGVHLGPSAEWMEAGEPLDYVHPEDAEWHQRFLEAARRYLPGIRADQIARGQVGYRPKLQLPGGEQADFLVWHDRGYVHLGGIESPGLTSSLPLAALVAEQVR